MRKSIMFILVGMVCAGSISAGEKSRTPPGATPAPPRPGTPLSAIAPAYESKTKEFAEKAAKAKEEGKTEEAKAYQGISDACAKIADALKNNKRPSDDASKQLSESLDSLKKNGIKLEGFLGGPMPAGGAPAIAPTPTPASGTDSKEVPKE